ncbi:MAG: DJ-1/PfpI family protein [Candidatus Eremiobacteraeota bacterium]|nr:DJ-1/PfpI family protein [Candidatus Eremiobacteraeota bacterium]
MAVVVGESATVIDFAGPWEVFQDAGLNEPDIGFEIYMVSDAVKPLRATGGMTIVPHHNYSTAPQPDVVFMGAQGEHTSAKIAWIQKASAKAELVISNCTGAFLLAKTGLLDGLSATTHHDFYDKFEKEFPRVRLVRGPRFVEHGKIMTGGGLSSGIEVALRAVERFYGEPEAARTAYYMEYNRSDHRPSSNVSVARPSAKESNRRGDENPIV